MSLGRPAAHSALPSDGPGWRSVPLDPRPTVVYAMGLTYASHSRETGEAPQRIAFEKRCAPTQGRPRIPVPGAAALHAAVAALDRPLADWLARRRLLSDPLLDYEVELGLVLLEDVTADGLRRPGAAPRIGYFLANDVSARAVQICGERARDRLGFWSAAKSFPGFLPVSARYWTQDTPTADGLLDARIETHVNRRPRQSARTLDLLWTVREMLLLVCESTGREQLPRHGWVLTGTPSGIALNAAAWQRRLLGLLPRRAAIAVALRANRRRPAFLRTGDEVRCASGIDDLTIESVVG
jgi:2-keto-4-pentenoate hydratase/2-oxohepta-3-ene-1,7-dioic acid hydratase in catechol pathway